MIVCSPLWADTALPCFGFAPSPLPVSGFPVLAEPCAFQACWSCRRRLPVLGHQRGHRRVTEPSAYRRLQVIKDRATLLEATGDHRPAPLAPAPPRFPARPLRHVPIQDHEPNRLLRQVVRRLHARRRHELEVRLAVLREALRQVLTRPRRRHIAQRLLPECVAGGTQSPAEGPLRQSLPLVEDRE